MNFYTTNEGKYLSILSFFWLLILYLLSSEAYTGIAILSALSLLIYDNYHTNVINKKEHERYYNNRTIYNYIVDVLIVIYVLVEFFYENKTHEYLTCVVLAYMILQKTVDAYFKRLNDDRLEQLRLEEELDKEVALFLTISPGLIISNYSIFENFNSSATDLSLLAISLSLIIYSGVKVVLETQNQNSKIEQLDNSEDNGTLGLSTKSFCSREPQDKYKTVAEDDTSNDGYKAISFLKLASIFKKMGLYKEQSKWLGKYKEIAKKLNLSDNENIASQEIRTSMGDTKQKILSANEEHLQKILKVSDIDRLVSNFKRDSIECKNNNANLRSKPTKGFLSILKILLIVFTILATLNFYKVIDTMHIEAATAGSVSLGALFLIFKDFSFSIFSGLRIYMDNLFSVGDKLQLDEFNITGKVVNFNPSTVEIRSSDNSITKIYMHKILSSTFTNLSHRKKRGRYINLTLNIDINTIVNLGSDLKLKDKLGKTFLLKRYLKCKEENFKISKENVARKEFLKNIKDEFYEGDNTSFDSDQSYILNTRDITNIGTFREYVFRYLSSHNLLDNDQYIMVRQLQPSDTGVVVEIKAYTEVQYSNKRDYERIYSDIVEHLIVTLPEFKLALFQAEASSGRKIEFL